jgi:putative sterol carrier protein
MMSDVLDAAVRALSKRMEGESFDGSVKFEIEGEGAVRLDGDGASIDDSEADCTITADQETFESMMAGDLNPTSAFMSGKLKIDGDMSKAMALASILS